jgi:RNA polymerase sigma-70 factor (ECF subfamily)
LPKVRAHAPDDVARPTARPVRAGTLDRRLEQHRTELTAFCRQMLGSCDAEDAVQETLVRAWRAFDRFEGRATLRSWLYHIARNVCFDGLRARQRQGRCIEMAARDLAGVASASPRHRTAESPTPTGTVDEALSNPADATVAREDVRLALRRMMRLPPRQRAVLILRDVLRWKAVETAELLDMTAGSVDSALQRARSMLAKHASSTDSRPLEDVTQRRILARYIDAIERYDLEALYPILRDEARRAPGAARRDADSAVVSSPPLGRLRRHLARRVVEQRAPCR